MNLLSVDNISKAFSDKVLFENISFGISQGEKTALVAANGTGKSTMMRIIAGEIEPDGGKISFNENVRFAYLEQQPHFESYLTISDIVTEALSKIDQERAWNCELKLKQLITTFGLTDWNQKIGEFSGGQKKRLAIAMTIYDDPDFLVLDEPTNHLDMEMVEWLERYLKQANVTILMVTHDRYFLDRVCNKIIELYDGIIYTHNGNFDYYVAKSREREENRRIAAEKAGRLMKRELEWIRATPQARTGKSKARIDAFYDLKERAKQRRDNTELQLNVDMRRLGGKILEMEHVSKSYNGINYIRDFDYVFKKGERIGIIGKNGIGKSTFLDVITGRETPDEGRVSVGQTVVYGYYTQNNYFLDENKSVLDTIRDIAEIIHYGQNRVYSADKLLAHFMFPHKMQQQPVSLLSGGEKRRLYLLTVLVQNPNFMILDEPTNDLDILTLQKLEDFLRNFSGCLIVVSHDRCFLDETVDQLFVFQGNGTIKGFMGNYSQYYEWLRTQNKEERANIVENKKNIRDNKPKNTEKKKRSFKEQKEYEALAVEIENLENEKRELTESLNDITDYQKIQIIGARLTEINDLLDEKEMRWLELDEI